MCKLSASPWLLLQLVKLNVDAEYYGSTIKQLQYCTLVECSVSLCVLPRPVTTIASTSHNSS